MTNEEIVREYINAMTVFDWATIDALRHPHWTASYPQSGELVPSSAADRSIMESYPGGAPRLLPAGRLVGTEDRWVSSPVGGAYLVAGEGENWWGEYKMEYPDGRTWLTVQLIELREGKIWRETNYWAEPFDPPQWRQGLVERLDPS